MLELYYLDNYKFCGLVTYTQHLQAALTAVGVDSTIMRISERLGKRRFSGLCCQGITLEAALASPNKKLVLSASRNCWKKSQPLIDVGAFVVVHNPLDVKKKAGDFPKGRTISIRKHLKVPESIFIPHPYQPANSPVKERTRHAACITRVAKVKRPDIMMAANRLLPKQKRIVFLGAEDSMYTYYSLRKQFPEWVSVKGHTKSGFAAAQALLNTKFSVDLTFSTVDGADGGGTQYTFLEAWDAGAINIINSNWTAPFDDVMKHNVNCIAVADEHELVKALNTKPTPDMVEAGRKQLLQHDPILIGEQYKQFLGL